MTAEIRTLCDVFLSAAASGKPAIVQLKIDPEAITPVSTLSKIRAQALATQDR